MKQIPLEERLKALTPLRRVESIDLAEREAREHIADINSPMAVPTLSLPLPPLVPPPPCSPLGGSPMIPSRIADPGTSLCDLWCS